MTFEGLIILKVTGCLSLSIRWCGTSRRLFMFGERHFVEGTLYLTNAARGEFLLLGAACEFTYLLTYLFKLLLLTRTKTKTKDHCKARLKKNSFFFRKRSFRF